jgi:chromosomal replication initiation ATPase DnaA
MRRLRLFDYVQDAVEYSTGVKDIKKDTRQRQYVDARRIAYHILRETHGLTLRVISTEFDRTHASILHGINSVDFLLKSDADFKNKYNNTVKHLSKGEFRKEIILKTIKDLQEEFLTLI